MIKKIDIAQLKPGMFVTDFNCSWLDHPFFTSSVLVKSDNMIQKIIKNGIRELYIDTDKGINVVDAPTQEEVRQVFQKELDKLSEAEEVSRNKISLEEEIGRAKEIKREAKKTVQNVMEDIKLGRPIETNRVEEVVDNMIDSILRNQDAMLSLGMIRKMDEYTYVHSVTVCMLMISFGKQMGFDADTLREVGMGALLHDIGKVKIPVDILHKKGSLSDEEYEIMKEHVQYSLDLIGEVQGISNLSLTMVYEHHERADGNGYPRGLKGNEISYYGQVIGIADMYDALTSDRCYRGKIQPTHALGKLYELGKYNFEEELVQQFIKCVGVYPIGSLVRLENGLLGIVIKHGEDNLLNPIVRIVYNAKREYYVMPYDIDLSKSSDSGGDRVISFESPDKWDIRPEMYL